MTKIAKATTILGVKFVLPKHITQKTDIQRKYGLKKKCAIYKSLFIYRATKNDENREKLTHLGRKNYKNQPFHLESRPSEKLQ